MSCSGTTTPHPTCTGGVTALVSNASTAVRLHSMSPISQRSAVPALTHLRSRRHVFCVARRGQEDGSGRRTRLTHHECQVTAASGAVDPQAAPLHVAGRGVTEPSACGMGWQLPPLPVPGYNSCHSNKYWRVVG